jgi:hypothetical protein
MAGNGHLFFWGAGATSGTLRAAPMRLKVRRLDAPASRQLDRATI